MTLLSVKEALAKLRGLGLEGSSLQTPKIIGKKRK